MDSSLPIINSYSCFYKVTDSIVQG